MKKIFTLLAVAFVASAIHVSGQSQTQQSNALQSPTENHFLVDVPDITPPPSVNSIDSKWIGYWSADTNRTKHKVPPRVPSSWYFHVFPDSTTITCDGGCYYNNIHSVGIVLDPFSPLMQSYYGLNWTEFSSYSIDSMDVSYFYQRRTGNSITDTLLVTVYTDEDMANLPEYLYSNQQSIYKTDTVRWAQMLYDYSTNSPIATSPTIIKVPLTVSDTSRSFIGHKRFAVNRNVAAGKHLVAASLSYKPGYAYNFGDTVTSSKNNFMFLTYSANDTTAAIRSYPLYSPGDWNCSFIARLSERYNLLSNIAWNGFYVPTWAFNASYVLEDHRISFKVTSLNVGVTENAVSGTKLYQNVPNPANNSTIIRYENQSAAQVSVELRDVTGRLIMTRNEGMQNAGNHEVTLDLSGISKGSYFYTLKVNETSLTRQMVIAN